MEEEFAKAVHLFNEGKHDEALEAMKSVYEESVKIFGTHHSKTSEVQFLMATILEQQDKNEEALLHSKEAYDKKVLTDGTDHLKTLDVQNTIALILAKQGNYTESLNLFEEVLSKQRKILGTGHEYPLVTWNNIAGVRAVLGEDVLPIYEEIYKLQKESYPERRSTLITRYNIAVQLKEREKYDEALKVLEELNDIHSGKNPEHIDALNCLNLTAEVLSKQGDHNGALEIYEKVHIIKSYIFGPGGPEAMLSYLAILEEVYKKQNTVLGPIHPQSLITQKSIAATLSCLDRYDDALSIYEYIATLQENSCPDHPDVLETQKSIAFTFLLQGKYDEAFQLYTKVLEIQTKAIHYGPSHLETLATKSSITKILIEHFNSEEAPKSKSYATEDSMKIDPIVDLTTTQEDS